ncbi:hypothetical protein [Clostridium sp. JN-9]|uniref:hypothetical protein n=1 Tax=Clostridium sp. JN-9 TaxID=2507159 RepID=UPI000FFE2A93|nr:hypothetical protein [Clostridium sp. JN-9]QAT41168.1 hypothetical protein EQM05_13350 [Clostridium sp. JN-9]
MKKKKGVALIITLCIVMLLTVLTTSLLPVAVSTKKLTSVYNNLDNVRLMAESGIEKAMGRINSGDLTGFTFNSSDGKINCSVTVEDNYNYITKDNNAKDKCTVTSTANGNSKSKTIIAVLDKITTPEKPSTDAESVFADISNNCITMVGDMDPNSETDDDIFNGTASVNSSAPMYFQGSNLFFKDNEGFTSSDKITMLGENVSFLSNNTNLNKLSIIADKTISFNTTINNDNNNNKKKKDNNNSFSTNGMYLQADTLNIDGGNYNFNGSSTMNVKNVNNNSGRQITKVETKQIIAPKTINPINFKGSGTPPDQSDSVKIYTIKGNTDPEFNSKAAEAFNSDTSSNKIIFIDGDCTLRVNPGNKDRNINLNNMIIYCTGKFSITTNNSNNENQRVNNINFNKSSIYAKGISFKNIDSMSFSKMDNDTLNIMKKVFEDYYSYYSTGGSKGTPASTTYKLNKYIEQ